MQLHRHIEKYLDQLTPAEEARVLANPLGRANGPEGCLVMVATADRDMASYCAMAWSVQQAAIAYDVSCGPGTMVGDRFINAMPSPALVQAIRDRIRLNQTLRALDASLPTAEVSCLAAV